MTQRRENGLVLPHSVTLRLVDSVGSPVKLPSVLFLIHTFARYKNDFYLGPFPTDHEGIANISHQDLDAQVTATFEWALMDYRSIEECIPDVEISIMSPEAIQGAIGARRGFYSDLARGEKKRWSSIQELIDLYQRALSIRVSAEPVRAIWDGSKKDYEYFVSIRA